MQYSLISPLENGRKTSTNWVDGNYASKYGRKIYPNMFGILKTVNQK
jgi:hypothetical protein